MIKGKEHSISPVLHALAGDVLEQGTGNHVNLKRNGAVVATATIGAPVAIQSGEITTRRVISSVFIAEEIKMANSLTISDVQHSADGTKSITFPDGNGVSNLSPEALDAMADLVFQQDWQLAFMVARWRAASPDYSADNSISGKTLEVHPDSDLNPLAIGEV